MYVQGMRALYAFEGYVVSQIKMDPFVAEVKLRRDRRAPAATRPACDKRVKTYDPGSPRLVRPAGE